MKKEAHSSSRGRSIAQRSSAEGARKRFSTGAQLTKHASVAPFSSSQTIQLYKEGTVDNIPMRISNDHVLGVPQTGGGLQMGLYVRGNPELALPVLNLHNRYETGTELYVINQSYMQDCGGYGNRLLDRIYGLNSNIELPVRTVTNATGGEQPLPFDYTTLFAQTVATQPAPGIGQAFLVVSNPQDRESHPRTDGQSPKHFNFHFGTVVAKSGSDVVTAEADSTRSYMQFQMYSITDLNQSFRQHYINMNKLDNDAKAFQVDMRKQLKPPQPMDTSTGSNKEKPIEL